MIVSVIAPHCRGNGNTTTALFLALGLGNMKKKVLLTHTNSLSDSLYTYLGLQQFEDKTSTPTQMVKLLREGAIQSEAIPDYCKNISDNVYVFTNNKTNFSNEDMKVLSEYIVEQSDFDYIIYDVNNLDTETANYVLRKSDIVVLNVTQSYMELDSFKNDMKKYSKMFKGKKIVLVCNKYSNIAGKDREVVERLGLKPPNLLSRGKKTPLELENKATCNVIHYNPWIIMSSNNGNFLSLYKYIKLKDAKVAELQTDINRLAVNVTKVRIANLKAKQIEKKELVGYKKDKVDRNGGEPNA